MITDNRMELYEQGLNDTEIARAVGRSQNTIAEWRKSRGLPGNYRPPKKKVRAGYAYRFEKTGIPMETALNPEQCEVMRDLFRLLLTAADRDPGNVDVSRIINFYRKEYGGEAIANIPRNPRSPK